MDIDEPKPKPKPKAKPKAEETDGPVKKKQKKRIKSLLMDFYSSPTKGRKRQFTDRRVHHGSSACARRHGREKRGLSHV